MRSLKYIKVSSEIIEKLIAHFPSKKIKSRSFLFYEGQIPISGFLILNGVIQISKRKKLKKNLETGSLIGVSELINHDPIEVTAEAFPSTEICFIDKSTILEMVNEPQSELSKFFETIIQKHK